MDRARPAAFDVRSRSAHSMRSRSSRTLVRAGEWVVIELDPETDVLKGTRWPSEPGRLSLRRAPADDAPIPW